MESGLPDGVRFGSNQLDHLIFPLRFAQLHSPHVAGMIGHSFSKSAIYCSYPGMIEKYFPETRIVHVSARKKQVSASKTMVLHLLFA